MIKVYDNRGRVSSVTDVFGQVVGYAYDANSNRTQLSLNGATNTTYQYDVLNRLTQLADAASLNTALGYDATDKLTSRNLPNGVATSYQYDGLDRLTRMTYSKGANTLADFQYQFNAVNNITQMIDSAGTQSFTYDSVDRLTSATHTGQANESYNYDDVGNRTASHLSASYTYQPFNRLASTSAATFSYDNNGNLLTKTEGIQTTQFTWDFENRLSRVSRLGSQDVWYKYDALGRRIERNKGIAGPVPVVLETSRFVYDGADVVRDRDGNGATIADYLNGPGNDNKLRQTVSGTASYFANDHLGTTRVLSDANGASTSSLSYDAFGSVANGSAPTRYTYTGRESDSDTGLMYYRARWYDPQMGRFVSEDPIGFSGGVNLYAYVRNNPIQYRDPSGKNPLVAILIVGGVIIAEDLLHSYLSSRAQGLYPNEPYGRQKHCYVNCMSLRIHLGDPVWPTIASIVQEVPPLIEGFISGNRDVLNDSFGDLRADSYGQQRAYLIWKSCFELCKGCQ